MAAMPAGWSTAAVSWVHGFGASAPRVAVGHLGPSAFFVLFCFVLRKERVCLKLEGVA